MDERRDQQAAPESGPTLPRIASASRLSPIQEAWSDYASHTTTCPVCRDVDRGPCDESERLWRKWQGEGSRAFRQLADET